MDSGREKDFKRDVEVWANFIHAKRTKLVTNFVILHKLQSK
jgi:hypothetical protein